MATTEQDPAKGRAFEKSFTAATALLTRALAALHAPANNPSQLAPIFEDLEQTLLDFRLGCCQSVDDQCRWHLENQLALLSDVIQMGRVAHPMATLGDAADELIYMTSLMRAQKDSS